MIYSLEGIFVSRGDHFLVVKTGGIGFKIFTNERTLARLPREGGEVILFCHLYVREDQLDLYGFSEEGALKLFEFLISVSGVGPKTALSVLDVDTVEHVMAAIINKQTEVLARASGIGKKTAERIVLELNNRIALPKAEAMGRVVSANMEIEDALSGLGYGRQEIRKVLEELGPEEKTLEDRLRQALRILGKR